VISSYSHLPLLALMDRISDWRRSARGEHFWEHIVDHMQWANRLRGETKQIILWLELRKRTEDADRLDAAMAGWRRALWELDDACQGVYPPDHPPCRQARKRLIDEADRLAGVAEDLDQDVPESVWEGYVDG